MVSWKWLANMLSANLALVVVSWSMYGWSMETGIALWSINMCQFVLSQKMKTVGEGIVKFPLLQESQGNFTDTLNVGKPPPGRVMCPILESKGLNKMV